MERIIAVSQIRALGLKIRNTGVLVKGGRDYGVLNRLALKTIDNRDIMLDEVSTFSFRDGDECLIAMMKDDSQIEIKGGLFTPDEIVDISLKQMPSTLGELNPVFEELYPEATTKLYYDELMERDMVDMSLFDRPDEGIRPVTDAIVSIYHEHLENTLKNAGYMGRMPARPVMDEVLTIQCYNHKRNLFREWVESHEWDGVPRVRTWFKDMFGAQAEPLKPLGVEDQYLEDVSETWFVGAIRRQYQETDHEVVPVLISNDQGIGKSKGLKVMAGADKWYVSTNVDVRYPNRFLESVRGSIIVEMAESTQMRDSDAESLKSFISKSSDQLRKSYARYDERFPRHFVFAATSNYDNIFTDLTGNRRYYPMHCDSTKGTKKRSTIHYEVEQVWAEALHLMREGCKWYLSDDTRRISKIMQDFCTIENVGLVTIESWLNDPINGYTNIGARVCRETIMRDIFGVDDRMLISKEMDEAYKSWVAGTKEWKKLGRSARINGKSTTSAYVRVCEPGEMPQVTKLSFLRDDDDDSFMGGGSEETDNIGGPDAVRLIRRLSDEQNVFELGEYIDVSELTQTQIDSMLYAGFIYDAGYKDNKLTYKLGILP